MPRWTRGAPADALAREKRGGIVRARNGGSSGSLGEGRFDSSEPRPQTPSMAGPSTHVPPTGPRTVTVIAGDGIGPEVLAATLQVLEATKVPLRYETCEAGSEIVARQGTNLPQATIDS